jgi:hypothetical protein
MNRKHSRQLSPADALQRINELANSVQPKGPLEYTQTPWPLPLVLYRSLLVDGISYREELVPLLQSVLPDRRMRYYAPEKTGLSLTPPVFADRPEALGQKLSELSAETASKLTKILPPTAQKNLCLNGLALVIDDRVGMVGLRMPKSDSWYGRERNAFQRWVSARIRPDDELLAAWHASQIERPPIPLAQFEAPPEEIWPKKEVFASIVQGVLCTATFSKARLVTWDGEQV